MYECREYLYVSVSITIQDERISICTEEARFWISSKFENKPFGFNDTEQ